jgi:hypothetical protein
MTQRLFAGRAAAEESVTLPDRVFYNPQFFTGHSFLQRARRSHLQKTILCAAQNEKARLPGLFFRPIGARLAPRAD